MTSSPPAAGRYAMNERLEQFGAPGQARLAAARVLVVGAGGLGSPALLYLAAAGVGELGVVDGDRLEVSNLQRQILYDTAGLGHPKADLAAARLRALNPGVRVRAHVERAGADRLKSLAAGADLVLDCADNFATKYAIADVCAALAVPWVWGTAVGWMAQVAVFSSAPLPHHPGLRPTTLRGLWPEPPAPPAAPGSPGAVPSSAADGILGAAAGLAGALMAAEAVKVLTGAGRPLAGRIAVIDALSGAIDVLGPPD